MIRPLPTLLVLGVLLSGCGSDGSDPDGDQGISPEATARLPDWPTCEEWTQRGVIFEEMEYGCRTGDTRSDTPFANCTDGRVLYWNEYVWGYVGERAHAHQTGAEQVAPDAEREACGI